MDKTDPSANDLFMEKGSEKGILTDPASTSTRFYMLFLACMLCIGSYFAYDNPAALETQLKDVIIT